MSFIKFLEFLECTFLLHFLHYFYGILIFFFIFFHLSSLQLQTNFYLLFKILLLHAPLLYNISEILINLTFKISYCHLINQFYLIHHYTPWILYFLFTSLRSSLYGYVFTTISSFSVFNTFCCLYFL